MRKPIDVFQYFLIQALSTTRPDGSDAIQTLMELLRQLADSVEAEHWTDAEDNLWVDLGGTTVFTAHLDTVCPKVQQPIKLYVDGDVWHTNGASTLGADDGAGIAVLAGLIAAKIPGLYLFTQGEEIGGYGARFAANTEGRRLADYKRAVAFDRKGATDICGSQCVGVLASPDFVGALAEQLNMGHSWADGLYTDNAEFAGMIPEIVNIACGYEHNHTKFETLDTKYLRELFLATLAVDWENLPCVGPDVSRYSFEDDGDEIELERLVRNAADALCIPEQSYDYQTLEYYLREAYEISFSVKR